VRRTPPARLEAIAHPALPVVEDLGRRLGVAKISANPTDVQIGEGSLIEATKAPMPWIGEIQVPDVPGPFEPGTGESNYRIVATGLRSAGYTGVIGLEARTSHVPVESGGTALAAFHAAF
jgi:hydroxypyruvate isomerase